MAAGKPILEELLLKLINVKLPIEGNLEPVINFSAGPTGV